MNFIDFLFGAYTASLIVEDEYAAEYEARMQEYQDRIDEYENRIEELEDRIFDLCEESYDY